MMRKLFLLLFVLMSLNAFSQLQVKEGSFKRDGSAVIDDKDEHYDDNYEPMALIKISTVNINEAERMRLAFKGNRATQIKKDYLNGQVWLYISKVADFIEISHPDYSLITYPLPETLCGFCVYEMTLEYIDSEPKSKSATIVIDSEPSGADIYIDGKHYGQTPNIIKDLSAGKYELKLEKQEYNPLTRIFVIDEGEKISFNETLLSVYYKGETQKIADNSRDKKETYAVKHSGENEVITVNGVTFTMIKVEGGTFQMGATSEQGRDAIKDEKPVHSVTLSDYYIGETEVTQELWEAVMGTTVYQQRDKRNNKLSMSGVGDNHPMYYVSWHDCKEFIAKLNRLTGKNFRLPTEAEWEYAARGGNKSKGYKYSGSNNIEDVVWYRDNSGLSTHDVKTKLPNELGIYDMSGNVWEWCEDWYNKKYYKESPLNNPKGPSSGSYRVLRVGSWYAYAGICRVSNRFSYSPDCRNFSYGFRLALQELQ